MSYLSGLKPNLLKNQNYYTQNIEDFLDNKDFIICLAYKITE
jgi:hypothetical protein